MNFDYNLIDKQQKEIINSESERVLIVAGRRTGKSTIIKEKTKTSNDNIIIIPFDGFQRSYRDCNATVITTYQLFLSHNQQYWQHFNENATIFIDELDLMNLSKEQIQDILEQPCKQLYILGTPKSLKSKTIVDNSLGFLQLKLEFESDLLQLYYGFKDNMYWAVRVLSFCNIPTEYENQLTKDDFESEFLPLK